MAETIYLSNVRLSFPKLIEASAAQDNAAKKFSADLIFVPNDPQLAKFMGEVNKLATEKWKDHAQAVLGQIQTDRKLRCYGNGAEKVDKKTYKPYTGYDGMAYVSANSNEDRPPQIMRPADGKEAANQIERTELARNLYGGCFVNVAIRPWAQDNQFGRAVRCELVAVQFAKDGDAFGEPAPDLSMFGAVAAAPAGPMPAMPFPSFLGQ